MAKANSTMVRTGLPSHRGQEKEHVIGVLYPEVSTRHKSFHQQRFIRRFSAICLDPLRLRLASQLSTPQIQYLRLWQCKSCFLT